MKRELLTRGLGLLVGTVFSPASLAQEVTGVPGSPSATSTIDGRQIPPPPATFGGTINLDAQNSTPYWQPQVVPPKGAPNILLIITDDVGFAAPSTFGGVIPHRRLTASPIWACATRSFTPPRSAPRRARPSSPGATTIRPASA